MSPPPLPPRARVLIVDDDAAVRGACAVLLDMLGYGTTQANSGREALAALRAQDAQVQLVMLDLEMPDMRGDEVLRALKRDRPELRVLLMSGNLRGEMSDYFAWGADGVLQKPFNLAALGQSVADATA